MPARTSLIAASLASMTAKRCRVTSAPDQGRGSLAAQPGCSPGVLNGTTKCEDWKANADSTLDGANCEAHSEQWKESPFTNRNPPFSGLSPRPYYCSGPSGPLPLAEGPHTTTALASQWKALVVEEWMVGSCMHTCKPICLKCCAHMELVCLTCPSQRWG